MSRDGRMDERIGGRTGTDVGVSTQLRPGGRRATLPTDPDPPSITRRRAAPTSIHAAHVHTCDARRPAAADTGHPQSEGHRAEISRLLVTRALLTRCCLLVLHLQITYPPNDHQIT